MYRVQMDVKQMTGFFHITSGRICTLKGGPKYCVGKSCSFYIYLKLICRIYLKIEKVKYMLYIFNKNGFLLLTSDLWFTITVAGKQLKSLMLWYLWVTGYRKLAQSHRIDVVP